ncbi:MAG TPA: MFS transporter [Actinomycetota bacterium]|nr:MFS transporter [Actinomycetota bacterium]
MRQAVGVRVLGARGSGRSLDRLAWVHAISTLGDALVAVALAGTLFFAVPVAAARPRVALYLLLTVAPFAVVAPLLGRLLDGRSGAGRLALFAAMVLRAALAALAVARTQSLLLYPLAFGLLVCSRAHGISRTAMVPELADPTGEPDGSRPGEAGGSRPGEAGVSGAGGAGGPGAGEAGGPGAREAGGTRPGRSGVWPDLVAVNGRMARVAALGGTAGALLGVGLDRLLGGGAVLWAAAITFTAGAVLALSLPAPRRRRERDPGAASRRDPMDRRAARLARPPGRVRLARTANTCVRAVGGFTLFLLAFELRRQGVGTAGLGLLLAGVGVGGVIGAFLLPRAARLVREDGLMAGGLLLCGTTAWLLAGRVGVVPAAVGGLAMGAGIAAARLGFESIVQREVPPPARGTAITRAETTFQLAWVGGAVLPVAFPLPTTPSLLAAAVACLAAATTYTIGLLRLGRGRRANRRGTGR